ncbi:hypothetical protein BASA50_009437 [Batrachochytrium salamandrivorans]|uniref:Glycosyltransferase family 92 protein n=1 Tax=Batrachochytrium salamandrivorans TaxID=1357716 RepID=A0ABQ8F4W8_9FUNG|nr:hypothetical protein BASA62_000661 [Batrachochytrium salamandrivorans]KAH6580705.1 hypothetical protein BASA60_002776 [Batrachochytrium salamandrivorans]KAH6590463.1 hypothetical protein BASA50_009437 [Batrachochytrium salamandrivorans]KAH6594095.1 hypothetical protein BASA61_004084 [Batrachochytrium salamandrivorans]
MRPLYRVRLLVISAISLIVVLTTALFRSGVFVGQHEWLPIQHDYTDEPSLRVLGQFVVPYNNELLTIKEYPISKVSKPNGEESDPPEFFLVAAAVVYNKRDYIVEWIEFHLLQGFDRFIIYDHMSTDDIDVHLKPYIESGIVELVVWPLDYNAMNMHPFGPRIWLSDEDKHAFEESFVNECLNVTDTWHIHGGCQRTAMQDAIARYRGRTEWISIFDVDEFFYITQTGKETTDLSSITTVRDILLINGTDYDHIRVPGKIFGTNGFLNTPLSKNGLPNRLVTEAYRYRTYVENITRLEEKYMTGRSYSEKSFARIRTVTNTVIHHFTFDNYESKGNIVREMLNDYSLVSMNHYQYLSHMQQNNKAFLNTNWGIYYWRPVDLLFCETADYSIGYLVPLLEYNIRIRHHHSHTNADIQRIDLGDLAETKKLDIKKDIQPAEGSHVNKKKLELCIAFTHINGEAHHLRRSVNTILHHLKLVERDIIFKTVLVMNEHSSPQEPSQPATLYLHDVIDQLDEVEILPANSFWAFALDRATARCSDAAYTLFMEDTWETRIQTGSMADYDRPGLELPMIRHAMRLMEHEENILEIWLGDIPVRQEAYEHTRTQWVKASYLPEIDRSASDIRLLRQKITDVDIKDAIWHDMFELYMKENQVVRRFGHHASKRSVKRQYTERVHTRAAVEDQQNATTLAKQSWPMTLERRSISLNDNSKTHIDATANTTELTRDNEADTTLSEDSDSVKESESVQQQDLLEDRHVQRARALSTEFYEWAIQQLGCQLHSECPAYTTYVRMQGMPGGSGLAVVRLGGTIKHNGRLSHLHSWMDAVKANPPQSSSLAIQETYGQDAIAHGLQSAHFCLTRPELQAECDLDPDYITDGSVTGIMWRQRILLDAERENPGFPDRPIE